MRGSTGRFQAETVAWNKASDPPVGQDKQGGTRSRGTFSSTYPVGAEPSGSGLYLESNDPAI